MLLLFRLHRFLHGLVVEPDPRNLFCGDARLAVICRVETGDRKTGTRAVSHLETVSVGLITREYCSNRTPASLK